MSIFVLIRPKTTRLFHRFTTGTERYIDKKNEHTVNNLCWIILEKLTIPLLIFHIIDLCLDIFPFLNLSSCFNMKLYVFIILLSFQKYLFICTIKF